MPSNALIYLDVRNWASNGSDGYTSTTASNGVVYSYNYTGGDNNGGHVTFGSRGHATIEVRVNADPRYLIQAVGFTNDANAQLSLASDPRGLTTVTMHNQNSAVQTANYKVTLTDSSANCTIPCDPQIINK